MAREIEDMGVAAGAAPRLAGHTPGPWCIDQVGNDIWIGPHIERGPAVLTVVNVPIGSYAGPSLIQRIADARLIAAAPNLLEALHLVGMSAGWQYLTMETRTVIEAAIAKAEGR